jgi:hypothetical protein
LVIGSLLRWKSRPREFWLSIEPAEPTDSSDPAEPIDRIEPAEPIDRIEPAEPIDAIEPAEPIDMIDPTDDNESIENADAAEPRLQNDMAPVSRFADVMRPTGSNDEQRRAVPRRCPPPSRHDDWVEPAQY